MTIPRWIAAARAVMCVMGPSHLVAEVKPMHMEVNHGHLERVPENIFKRITENEWRLDSQNNKRPSYRSWNSHINASSCMS